MRFALVSIPTTLRSTPNSVSISTWNCGQGCPNTNVLSVWENEYLQYSWIIFPHCATELNRSKLSFG